MAELPVPNLRTRQKAMTRELLTSTALRLFNQHGYDHVPITLIADTAGVARRTFFRYFQDKEELLFDGDQELVDIALRTISGSRGDAVWDRAKAAVTAFAVVLEPHREALRRRESVISSSSALTARNLLKKHRHTTQLASALADDQGVDPAEASLAAALATACFDHAHQRWLAPGAVSLPATLHDVLAQAGVLIR